MSDIRVKTQFGWKDVLGSPEGRMVIVEGVATCPESPITIPGITAADALDASDTMGTVVKLQVPKAGIIYSATFFDIDAENTQVNLHIFNHSITQIASDAAWAPSDADIVKLVTTIPFFSFRSHTNSYVSEAMNIGKLYAAPEGFFYIQAQVGGTAQTIAAGKSPLFQLQIIPLEA